MEALNRALQENLTDRDALWAAMEALQVVAGDLLTYKHKLSNIDKIISSMEDEIMMAPAGINPADRDTFQTRQILVLEKRNKQELANDAFTAYESRYKRLKSDYDQLTNADGTPRTKSEPGTPEAGAEARAGPAPDLALYHSHYLQEKDPNPPQMPKH